MITPPRVTQLNLAQNEIQYLKQVYGAWSRVPRVCVCRHSHRYVYKKRFLKDHVCGFLVSLKHFSGYGRLQDFLIILVWPPTHCLHPWVASNSHSSVLSLFYVEQFVMSIPIRNSWQLLQIKMAWRFLSAGFIIFRGSWVQKVFGHLSHT